MAGRVPTLLLSLVALASPGALAQAQVKPLPWLRADGVNLVDSAGKRVALKGFNLNGAFVFEAWASAFDMNRDGTSLPEIKDERALWAVLTTRFDAARAAELRRVWRTAWAGEADVERLAGLGCNVVRIPFWYRVLEDDDAPGVLQPDGLAPLDALVDACARHRVYAILDLHGAPGGQSKADHTGQADRNELWASPQLRSRTAKLWAAIARHYRDRPDVAAYDLLNEPMGAPDAATVIAVHDEIIRAIRAVDARHVIVVEDGYKGPAAFPPKPAARGWRNVAYSVHHYRFDAKSPDVHFKAIEEDLPKLRKRQLEWGVPLLIGEFSTIGRDAGGMETMAAYLKAFDGYAWSWTAWMYKKVSPKDGRENFWGLVTNDKPFDRPNPFKDSFDVLKAKFSNYQTSHLAVQEEYAAVVKAATARVGK